MGWWKTKRNAGIEVGAYSDVGQVRSENQDAFGRFTWAEGRTDEEHLFVVADGMGGHERGEEASQTAVQVLHDIFFDGRDWSVGERLRRAFEAANARVYEQAHSGATVQKMGTTCTALALIDGHAYMAHVGDSRAYRINESGITQLTHDHTLVEELRRRGVLTEDEARQHPRRHALTRALGIEPALEVDVLEAMPLQRPERFLLCSDGLAPVTQDEIHEVVMTNTPQEACERLVAMANERGGPDNVTVVLVTIE